MVDGLTIEQLCTLLDVAPMELAFIDADDNVRFWNRETERGPAWQPSVLGGPVQRCHRQASVPAVNGVLAKLKSGGRDVVDRRVMTDRGLTRFRWFAVRDEEGRYLGCLEMIQHGPEVADEKPQGGCTKPGEGEGGRRTSTSVE